MAGTGVGKAAAMDAQSRIVELEEQVRVLAAGLGLRGSFRIPDEVRAHALAGRTVEAVRALRRDAPGRLGLVAAKRMVDSLRP